MSLTESAQREPRPIRHDELPVKQLDRFAKQWCEPIDVFDRNAVGGRRSHAQAVFGEEVRRRAPTTRSRWSQISFRSRHSAVECQERVKFSLAGPER